MAASNREGRAPLAQYLAREQAQEHAASAFQQEHALTLLEEIRTVQRPVYASFCYDELPSAVIHDTLKGALLAGRLNGKKNHRSSLFVGTGLEQTGGSTPASVIASLSFAELQQRMVEKRSQLVTMMPRRGDIIEPLDWSVAQFLAIGYASIQAELQERAKM